MREVPLHGQKAAGRVALVDDADYEVVMQFRWWVWEVPEKNYGPYAQTRIGTGRKAPKEYMHKLITGWPQTDHANHNGLDNQRENLRPATHSQNRANQRPIRRRVSQHKGVTPRYGRWAAQIKTRGEHLSLGVYDTELEAALAYDAAARHYFGQYSCLNFPETNGGVPAAGASSRRCVICGGFIDPVDFCEKCADLAQKCDTHSRPRRRANAETCNKKCQNARRYAVDPASKGEDLCLIVTPSP